jgi:hypothetical protein
MDEREEDRAAKPEPSWLDEVSFATKLVVAVTLLTIAGYVVLVIADLLL